MRRLLLSLTVVLYISVDAFAQVPDSVVNAGQHVRYYNQFLSGALIGNKGEGIAQSFAMVHGIRIQKWSFGAGLGFDSYYEWQLAPITAVLTKDFGRSESRAFFLQVSVGKLLGRDIPRENGLTLNYDGGHSFHPALGIRLNSNKLSAYILAGYSMQQFRYHQSFQWWWWGDQSSNRISVEREINRFSISLGVGLR